MPLLLTLLCLAAPARAGDVWLTVDTQQDDGEVVHLALPGNWLLTSPDPQTVDTDKGTVDLRDVAKAVHDHHEGTVRRMDAQVDGKPAHIELHHEPVAQDGATSLVVDVAGPKGNGLSLAFPLDAKDVQDEIAANMHVGGVPSHVDDEFAAQLRRAPATTVMQIHSGNGSSVVVRTR
jgi:hypothetical protein